MLRTTAFWTYEKLNCCVFCNQHSKDCIKLPVSIANFFGGLALPTVVTSVFRNGKYELLKVLPLEDNI